MSLKTLAKHHSDQHGPNSSVSLQVNEIVGRSDALHKATRSRRFGANEAVAYAKSQDNTADVGVVDIALTFID